MRNEPSQSGQRPQRQQPASGALVDRQRHRGETDDHQIDRPLDQDAGGERGPKDRRQCPAEPRVAGFARRKIGARQHAHGGDDREQQHGVGLGEPRFAAEQRRSRHHQRRQDGAAPGDEGEPAPIRGQNRADGADERRDAVEPDGGSRIGETENLGGLHHRRLQPVDADRFAVANVVLIADIDIIAGFDHLLGGLREIGLVAIDRRNLEKARQKQDQRNKHENGHSAPVRARADVEKRAKAVCRPQSRRRAACRGHARSGVNTPKSSSASRKAIMSRPLDDLPILVIDELETLGQQANG